MSIRERKFEWNGKGLKPIDAPGFDYGTPVHFAHDLVEHLTDGEDFRSELLAAGATIFGRGADHPIQLEITGEDMANFIAQQGYIFPKIAQRWFNPLKDERAERQICILANRAVEYTPVFDRRYFGSQIWQMDRETLRARLEVFKACLRLGYMHAKRFYRGLER